MFCMFENGAGLSTKKLTQMRRSKDDGKKESPNNTLKYGWDRRLESNWSTRMNQVIPEDCQNESCRKAAIVRESLTVKYEWAPGPRIIDVGLRRSKARIWRAHYLLREASAKDYIYLVRTWLLAQRREWIVTFIFPTHPPGMTQWVSILFKGRLSPFVQQRDKIGNDFESQIVDVGLVLAISEGSVRL